MGTWSANYQLYLAAAGEQGWADAINGNFDAIDAELRNRADALDVHKTSHDTTDGKLQLSTDLIVPTPNTISGNLNGNVTGAINGWNFATPKYYSPAGDPQTFIMSRDPRVIWDSIYPITGYISTKGIDINDWGGFGEVRVKFYDNEGGLLSSDDNRTSTIRNVPIPDNCHRITVENSGKNFDGFCYYYRGTLIATLLPGITTTAQLH